MKKIITKDFLLTTILITLFFTSFIVNIFMYNEINSLEEENNILVERKKLLKNLEEASIKNRYNLFNPTFNESISFLENNSNKNINEIINLAKDNGIRSALVIIEIDKEWMTELIAFETFNQGFCFFETNTTYQVIPEVGRNYNECVFDKNKNIPGDITITDPITDILVIW